MSLKKGDFVKCISCPDGEFTAGQKYEVKAGAGDEDTVCFGYVGVEAFIATADNGEDCYCVFPSCCYGEWEIV